MCRKFLFVLVAGFSVATVGGCQTCCSPYDYTSPVMSVPAAGGCTNCVSTPSVTYQSQTPTPALTPVR